MCWMDAGAAAAAGRQEAARLAAYSWATDASFGRTGCGAPKVMADVLEALIGAVYLDCHRCAPLMRLSL